MEIKIEPKYYLYLEANLKTDDRNSFKLLELGKISDEIYNIDEDTILEILMNQTVLS